MLIRERGKGEISDVVYKEKEKGYPKTFKQKVPTEGMRLN